MSSQESRQFYFKLSAPGKVILFGEYSVVFNKPAIAATLDLHTKLSFKECNSGIVNLNFSALKLDKSFSLKSINNLVKITETESWDGFIVVLGKAVQDLYMKTYGVFDVSDAQQFSLLAFFYCFSKAFGLSKGFDLKIDSELSLGSGVGSSASFSIVLSAAALLYENYIKGKENYIKRSQEEYIISEDLKKQIGDLAFSCEKIFHGNPSGVDHNTILRGSMLEFIKTENENKITPIETLPIKILLVNTNIPRSTKKLVETFKQLKENHPEIISDVLSAMGNIAKSAAKVLSEYKNNNKDTCNLENYFGELISLNHNLLRVLGVSHPKLENIVATANKFNLKAKLTGAGGGGFAFIYLPSNVDVAIIKTIQKELSLDDCTVSEVTLGRPGLQIEEMSS